MTEPTVEARRLAIEIMATLVHIKRTMSERLLKPAGIPSEVYANLLNKRDEATGRKLSKRQIAPLILDAVEDRPDCAGVVRRLIDIAAKWGSFHLAHDEYQARATVQKARELLGTIEIMEAREAKQRELARKEAIARMEHEHADMIRKQSELLLMMFEEMASSGDAQRRGYLLQDLLNRTFDLHRIAVVGSFTRNKGGEQIDGAFKLDGWHYLVECRWRKKPSNIRDLDGLTGQIARSGKQTMGLFLAINGWSSNVVDLLQQNQEKATMLMDGYDLRAVLSGPIDLGDLLLAKNARLNLRSEPFFSVLEHLEGT